MFVICVKAPIVTIRPGPQKVATSLIKTVPPSETAETFILSVKFRFMSCSKFVKL